jgi:hypothetical protein
VGAGLLAGFGLWHVVDSVLSHWVLGIHRIRVDAENPLAWDLLWLGLFGLLPMALAWGVARGGGGRAPRVAALLLVTLGLGAWALRAPPGQPYTLAVFRPGLSAQTVEARVEDLGGRVVWSAPDVALIDLPVERRWNLYGVGALIVSGTGLPQGCLGWSDVSA